VCAIAERSLLHFVVLALAKRVFTIFILVSVLQGLESAALLIMRSVAERLFHRSSAGTVPIGLPFLKFYLERLFTSNFRRSTCCKEFAISYEANS
jgi:hypothetical protein